MQLVRPARSRGAPKTASGVEAPRIPAGVSGCEREPGENPGLSRSGEWAIHTHLCYSEFGEIIDAIANLDADVTSIEAARSHMEVLDDLNAVGFDLDVYDIHFPRVPSVEEIATSLREALDAVPAQRLWVNPDCGLKTRGPVEVEASLRNLVDAAKLVRAGL